LSKSENLTLITGGARSGKSDFAERQALALEAPVFYIATMEEIESDGEGVERIKRHRGRRPKEWVTIEVPKLVHEAVDKLPQGRAACIIDCLSLYVSNLVLSHRFVSGDFSQAEENVIDAVDKLVDSCVARSEIEFFVVTNEVGWGIVPENNLARAYRDLLGFANQRMARAASSVYLCCVGLQTKLK